MRGISIAVAIHAFGCGPTARHGAGDDDANGDAGTCAPQCSADLHTVLDCNGNVVMQCTGADACDSSTGLCEDACIAASADHRSVGCDYYATDMDVQVPQYCFAMFVANTWNTAAHIGVDYKGVAQSVASFTRIPTGSGPNLTYAPYDATAGVAPGDVAVLFLGGTTGAAPDCPTTTVDAGASHNGNGIFDSFHVTTDVPVVAYQISPYGGGSAAVTAASLLLPTSVWDVNYVAVNVSPPGTAGYSPSLNIVARDDATAVTIVPTVAIDGGNGIPTSPAGTPVTIQLHKGQHAQITQPAELTGSVVTSTSPIGFMAGQPCMNMPAANGYCDHGEQMVPPVHALGSRYVGVMYRPRVPAETSTFWRLVGAVDGTQLTWSSPVGGPPTLDKGQSVIFQTGTPFVVSSQDNDHPFMLFTYMTSSTFVASGFGDPDFVVSVPPEQYLSAYVFFTDPTYPETNLVVVRARGSDGQFHDVNLDCAGPLSGWQTVGEFQYTRADLVTGNFMAVGNCSTGRHEITSDATFGLWVWGWGTPNTATFTANVSYGYPGGMNVAPINNVIIE